ncbi:MAG: DNA repair protein RadC [Desulfobacteraceae bacterium]|jgi:DNA repair protein RadC
MTPKCIKDRLPLDRPREKLVLKGTKALSDVELLAVLLGSGIKGKDVIRIAREILKKMNKGGEILEIDSLLTIDGIGLARAGQLLAALEFARRHLLKESNTIKKPGDAFPLLAHIADKKQEYFLCLTLNGANEVIGNRIITIGLLNRNQIHPREVFADAISDRAASIIIAHNHPSGLLEPGPEDLDTTNRLVDAGLVLGIAVLDHVIVSKNGYYSFKENNLI